MLKDPDTEASTAKAREHLIAFVEEMVAGMAHVRQRTNALLYVRGLIEHGGRKSLQPTLLRLGEDAACYKFVQQFLADSPWDADLLVRACAERVSAATAGPWARGAGGDDTWWRGRPPAPGRRCAGEPAP
ncbi:MAG: transposase [Coprothermobacterota bacterium]|nr:transposase [Coprothermobacterota bacterium]